jgi:hypothetical protein
VYYVALFGISTFLTLFFELKDDAKFLQKMLIESYQILLIAIAFYLFSTLVGFTLYFIILHSFKVLIQEYDFLKRKTSIKGLLHFIQLLTPFTMLSIAGMAIIFSVIHFLGLNVSIPLLLLILVSSITLPHSYVMDIFYQRGGSGQASQ